MSELVHGRVSEDGRCTVELRGADVDKCAICLGRRSTAAAVGATDEDAADTGGGVARDRGGALR